MQTIRKGVLVLGVAALFGGSFLAAGPDAAHATPIRRLRIAVLEAGASLPGDLISPEGKSRWDLRQAILGRSLTRSIAEAPGGGIALLDEGDPLSAALSPIIYREDLYSIAPAGNGDTREAARRWLLPDRYPDLLRPGARASLDFLEERDGRPTRVHADVETVGIGWLDLPSGPREVVLQRALVKRDDGVPATTLVHRFIDPLAGIVAEIVRATAGGPVLSASLVEQVLLGASTLKLYVDALDTPPFTGITYGWDRGPNTPVSSLTPQGYATIGDLLAADTWDFSANTTGIGEDASTGVLVTPAETCNAGQCGYNPGGTHPNRVMSREDITATAGGALTKTNAVTEREVRPADVTVWLRGGAQNEGVSGSLGMGESRFCYTNDDGLARSPVPIWRFPNQDAFGFYMQAGDPAFVGGPFNCEQNLFNTVCGSGGVVPMLWSKACGTHTGTQFGQVMKGGVVTLPSGHTFNALLVKTVADFCVYIAAGCSSIFKADEVRTFVYLWQVPVIGTVARITSAQNVADGTSFTTVAGTDFQFGLFPPLSMSVTGTTDTSVALSWDPGRDTHRINRYKVYWGTVSGSTAAYAFDSVHNPAQVAFAGTTAVVSGLTAGTTYYFTITSLSDFRDPSTGVTTTYESLVYPTQVSGDPAFVYPIEVQGRTTGGACIPTAEVTGLTVEHATGGNIRICWSPVTDPCLVGYQVLGAASPTAAANFSIVADTDLSTCFTGNPAGGYFLVTARGTGGTGPWGAYGR